MKLNSLFLFILLSIVLIIKTNEYPVSTKTIPSDKKENEELSRKKFYCEHLHFKTLDGYKKNCEKINGVLIMNFIDYDSCTLKYACLKPEEKISLSKNYSQCVKLARNPNIYCSVEFTNINCSKGQNCSFLDIMRELSNFLPFNYYYIQTLTRSISGTKTLPNMFPFITVKPPFSSLSTKVIPSRTQSIDYTNTPMTKTVCSFPNPSKFRIKEYCADITGFLLLDSFLPNCDNYYVCFRPIQKLHETVPVESIPSKDLSSCIKIYGRYFCEIARTNIECNNCTFLEHVNKISNIFGKIFIYELANDDTKTFPIITRTKTISIPITSNSIIPITMTTSSKTIPTDNGSDKYCADNWAQCGGEGFTGPTCCKSGYICKEYSSYYSQCTKNF